MNLLINLKSKRALTTISLFGLVLSGLNLSASTAMAETAPSFAVASVDAKGTAVASFTAGVNSGSGSTTDQLIAISSDATSALWLASITTTSSVLILRTKAGVSTLLPKSLIDPQKALFPTANGVIIQQGREFSYLSSDSALAGSSAIKVGSIPVVQPGYFRDISSITAVDGAVYVATVDYQIAATDPTLGLSHLWYLSGDTALEVFSATSQYITSLQISPADPAKFAALFVRVGNRNTFYGQAIGSLAIDHTATIDDTITWMATNPSMLDQSLGWMLQDGNYVPAIVDVLSSNTVVHTFQGASLAIYPARSNVIVAPSNATFEVTGAIRNKIQRTISAGPVLPLVMPYNTVLTNTGLATASSLGYTDAVSVPLSITIGTKTTPFTLNKKATANFCLSASVPEAGALAAATGTFCAKVQAQLTVTVKKRVFTVLSSSSKMVIQTLVKKKWTVAKIKYKLVKGKAVITVKPGSYKFLIATTPLNEGNTSKAFTVK